MLVAVSAGVAGLAWLLVQNAVTPPRVAVGPAPQGATTVHLGIDAVRIDGWWVPPVPCDQGVPVCLYDSSGSPAVVVIHGNRSSRELMRSRISLLRAHGVGVLAIDQRGRGTSSGQTTLGQWEPRDASAAARWVMGQPAVDPNRVVLDGASFGGLVAVLAAADDPAIAGVVAESPAGRGYGVQATGPTGVLIHLGLWLHGLDTSATDGVTAAGRLWDRPTLIVVGQLEAPDTARSLADSAAGSLWIAPGGHTEAPDVAPRQWVSHVLGVVARTG
jgi:pimeloyl-ACP methyl ester carboxylesterase